jgi:Tfp pilus assembly protein PilN
MPRINLLPERQAKKAPVSPKRLVFIVVVEVVVVAALAVGLSQLFTMRQMERELAQVGAQLATMQQDLDVLNRVQTRAKEMDALADEIRSIQAENCAPAPVLRELRNIIPQDVWLESFSTDPKGAISIGGATFSMESAARLSLQLERSPVFVDVKLGSVSLGSRGESQVYTFSIGCALETAGAGR